MSSSELLSHRGQLLELPPITAAVEAALARAAAEALAGTSPFAQPWGSPAGAGRSTWRLQERIYFDDSDASSEESNDSSPVAADDKGKAVVDPSHAQARANRPRRRHCAATSAFMADAGRPPPSRP
ncbi:uncharacterized protein [Miscanthus floridulus]|uniref:uncharacterized protein n=1 Tax=Miscanthus floridulus TaxID=154761 RepID=UPI0034586482